MKATTAFFGMIENAGFVLIRCNNHAIWRCPCGAHKLTTARTPSQGSRAIDNARGNMNQVLRRCQETGWRPA